MKDDSYFKIAQIVYPKLWENHFNEFIPKYKTLLIQFHIMLLGISLATIISIFEDQTGWIFWMLLLFNVPLSIVTLIFTRSYLGLLDEKKAFEDNMKRNSNV